MNCTEMAKFLIDYFERELPPEIDTAFRGHLGGCPDCGSYLEEYRTTIQLGRDSFCDNAEALGKMPSGLREAILRSVSEKGGEPGGEPPTADDRE